jgi:iron complex outermembrane recepter protein
MIRPVEQAYPSNRKSSTRKIMNRKSSDRRTALSKSLGVGCLTLCALAVQSALAQQAAPPATQEKAADPAKVERIEVTGSRILSANLEGPSPITVIDAQAIKADGLRSVENLLNNLPQVFAGQGGNVSNGSSGTANVDLRGFGPTRTLVLVNGRRLPAGSPRAGASSAATDLNQIPAPLIKRVELLTGGAGAVYGSDAVAGVVNFIMNNRFEGVQVEFNQSFYNHKQQNPQNVGTIVAGRGATNPSQFVVPGDKSSDGKIYDANIIIGSNFGNGRGNATVFFNYKKEDALLQSERDFSACTLGSNAAGFTCSGSGTTSPAQFLLLPGTVPSRVVTNAAGNTRVFNPATDVYNFGPLNYYQRPSERYGFNAYVNYDLDDKTNVYTEFSFHDDRTVAQIAPSGIFFGGSGSFNIAFENPLLSSDFRRDFGLVRPGDTAAVLIGRRNVEGGGRQDDIRHTSYRSVIGVKGLLGAAWNYDVSMQVGKVAYQETYKNEFSNMRIARALDVVVGPNGTPVCRSVTDGTDPNCIPYNVFAVGGVTPAALSYIQIPGVQSGETSQSVASANISGDLGVYGFQLPTAKSGVGVVFGVEQRTEKLALRNDAAFQANDLAGQGGATLDVDGKYTVKDFYAEFRAPLIEGGFMADLLSISGSYRRSDYSIDQKTDTYGMGIEWAPIKQARLRGSYQQAARAANVNELFAQQTNGLFNLAADPCAGAAPSATLAQCQRTGVTAAQYGSILGNPAGQYNTITGGNTALRPEKSKSYTVGVVLEPMRNFSATLDYFSIKLDDVISTLPPAIVLQQCIATGQFCNLIARDSIGSLWAQPSGRIVATNINIASLKTTGVDIGVNYAMKVGAMGQLAFALNGTLLKSLENEPIPGTSYDCKGLHGPICGTPAPKWRHKFRTSWATPWNLDLALTWRHVGKVDNEATSSFPSLTGTIGNINRTLSERNYFDLAASWTPRKALTLRGGINNILDKDPPIANSTTLAAVFGNGNTYPQVYDALGRRIFLNATYKF